MSEPKLLAWDGPKKRPQTAHLYARIIPGKPFCLDWDALSIISITGTGQIITLNVALEPAAQNATYEVLPPEALEDKR